MSSGHFVLAVDPRERFEVSLYDAKIGVWCAVSGQWIVGPTFFNNTMKSHVYVMELLQPIIAQLTEEECEYAFFQQDGATAHTSRFSMSYVHEAFGEEHTVPTGLWPPRLPDLATCNFYLWINLKGEIYSNN